MSSGGSQQQPTVRASSTPSRKQRSAATPVIRPVLPLGVPDISSSEASESEPDSDGIGSKFSMGERNSQASDTQTESSPPKKSWAKLLEEESDEEGRQIAIRNSDRSSSTAAVSLLHPVSLQLRGAGAVHAQDIRTSAAPTLSTAMLQQQQEMGADDDTDIADQVFNLIMAQQPTRSKVQKARKQARRDGVQESVQQVEQSPGWQRLVLLSRQILQPATAQHLLQPWSSTTPSVVERRLLQWQRHYDVYMPERGYVPRDTDVVQRALLASTAWLASWAAAHAPPPPSPLPPPPPQQQDTGEEEQPVAVLLDTQPVTPSSQPPQQLVYAPPQPAVYCAVAAKRMVAISKNPGTTWAKDKAIARRGLYLEAGATGTRPPRCLMMQLTPLLGDDVWLQHVAGIDVEAPARGWDSKSVRRRWGRHAQLYVGLCYLVGALLERAPDARRVRYTVYTTVSDVSAATGAATPVLVEVTLEVALASQDEWRSSGRRPMAAVRVEAPAKVSRHAIDKLTVAVAQLQLSMRPQNGTGGPVSALHTSAGRTAMRPAGKGWMHGVGSEPLDPVSTSPTTQQYAMYTGAEQARVAEWSEHPFVPAPAPCRLDWLLWTAEDDLMYTLADMVLLPAYMMVATDSTDNGRVRYAGNVDTVNASQVRNAPTTVRKALVHTSRDPDGTYCITERATTTDASDTTSRARRVGQLYARMAEVFEHRPAAGVPVVCCRRIVDADQQQQQGLPPGVEGVYTHDIIPVTVRLSARVCDEGDQGTVTYPSPYVSEEDVRAAHDLHASTRAQLPPPVDIPIPTTTAQASITSSSSSTTTTTTTDVGVPLVPRRGDGVLLLAQHLVATRDSPGRSLPPSPVDVALSPNARGLQAPPVLVMGSDSDNAADSDYSPGAANDASRTTTTSMPPPGRPRHRRPIIGPRTGPPQLLVQVSLQPDEAEDAGRRTQYRKRRSDIRAKRRSTSTAPVPASVSVPVQPPPAAAPTPHGMQQVLGYLHEAKRKARRGATAADEQRRQSAAQQEGLRRIQLQDAAATAAAAQAVPMTGPTHVAGITDAGSFLHMGSVVLALAMPSPSTLQQPPPQQQPQAGSSSSTPEREYTRAGYFTTPPPPTPPSSPPPPAPPPQQQAVDSESDIDMLLAVRPGGHKDERQHQRQDEESDIDMLLAVRPVGHGHGFPRQKRHKHRRQRPEQPPARE